MLLNNPMMNPVHTHDANYFPPAPPMSHVSNGADQSSLYSVRVRSSLQAPMRMDRHTVSTISAINQIKIGTMCAAALGGSETSSIAQGPGLNTHDLAVL